MSIYKGSRYYYSLIDFFSPKEDQADRPFVIYNFSALGLINYWEHQYIQGERLDQIAFKYYKRPEAWWYIAEYNPEIVDFNNIVPGTILRIPNV